MIEKLVQIGGKYWNVRILSISESFEIKQSDNTGNTIDLGAPTVLDPLGTWYSHRVRFGRKSGDVSEFDKLFEFVSQPRYEGVPVRMVHGQKSIEYDAMFETGERKLRLIHEDSGLVEWETFEVLITPVKAQVIP